MKLYEIEGFDKGVKVKEKRWKDNQFIYFNINEKCFYSEIGKPIHLRQDTLMIKDDWEIYQEPKLENTPQYCYLSGIKINGEIALKLLTQTRFGTQTGLDELTSLVIKLDNFLNVHYGERLTEMTIKEVK